MRFKLSVRRHSLGWISAVGLALFVPVAAGCVEQPGDDAASDWTFDDRSGGPSETVGESDAGNGHSEPGRSPDAGEPDPWSMDIGSSADTGSTADPPRDAGSDIDDAGISDDTGTADAMIPEPSSYNCTPEPGPDHPPPKLETWNIPRSPRTGTTITFIAEPENAASEGTIQTAFWDWDHDGSYESDGRLAGHLYHDAGDYEIPVVAYDDKCHELKVIHSVRVEIR